MNKVILIGNLGQDPEIRELTSGKVANMSVATTHRWKDRDGNKKEETDWHRVSMFGGLATLAASYLHKGSKVCVEGRIKTRSFENKDGQKQYVTEVVAENLELLGERSAASNGRGSDFTEGPDDIAF